MVCWFPSKLRELHLHQIVLNIGFDHFGTVAVMVNLHNYQTGPTCLLDFLPDQTASFQPFTVKKPVSRIIGVLMLIRQGQVSLPSENGPP